MSKSAEEPKTPQRRDSRGLPLDTSARKKMLGQARILEVRKEQQFADFAEVAEGLLPKDAKHPLFMLILRLLWRRFQDSSPDVWATKVPKAYSDFKESNPWMFNAVTLKGELPEAGIEALAGLLVAMRSRQRELEG